MNLLTILISIITVFTTSISAHNILLPLSGRRCFFEQLSRGDELSISFQFGDRDPMGSHQLTGDFIIYGSQRNEVLKTLRDVPHGEVTINAPYTGKFQYCFLNENSHIMTKDVTFNIYGTVYVDLDDPNSNTLDGSVKQLSKLVREVRNEQTYIVIRERTHRNTAESTNSRVKWWSIFQLAVVVVNSLFQIYYLKRFFEVTSYV